MQMVGKNYEGILGHGGGLKQHLGISAWWDVIDWVESSPFEVAMPEEIFGFYHQRGSTLEQLKTCGSEHACNEHVFRKA